MPGGRERRQQLANKPILFRIWHQAACDAARVAMASWLSGPTPLVSTVLSPARSTRCFTLPGRKIRLGAPSPRGHWENRMARKRTLAGISAGARPVVPRFAKRVRKFAKAVTNSAAAARKSAGTARKFAAAVRNYGETVRELAGQVTPATRRIAKRQTSANKSRSRTFSARAIFTRESTEGHSLPRSTRLIKAVERSAFSASFSWLNFNSLRLARTAPPSKRRCCGVAGMTG